MKKEAGATPLHPCPRCGTPTSKRCYCADCVKILRKPAQLGQREIKIWTRVDER